MGAGRKTDSFILSGTATSSARQATHGAMARNLGKSNLGGVMFGCKNSTIRECLFKQLFGLPGQHISYVKDIEPGLPLFLFNYSDRKLHGIFEASSSGQMNINPYAWTSDGSERTPYPAQVQVHIKLQCQPLTEDQFKPIILDNYYNPHHFWFELDHGQANKLMSKLSAAAIAPSTFQPQNATKWRTIFRTSSSNNKREGTAAYEPSVMHNSPGSNDSNLKLETSDISISSDYQNGLPASPQGDHMAEMDARDLMYMQLKELALNHKLSDASIREHAVEFATASDQNWQKSCQTQQPISEEKNGKNCGSSFDSSHYPSVIAELLQGIQELKAFKEEQIVKADHMEQKLLAAEEEIRHLKSRYMVLESTSCSSLVHADGARLVESLDDLNMDLGESIFLIGGHDGDSCLSALDLYSPSLDVLKSQKPMNSVRLYSSVVKLNGELYVFGGGSDRSWYDTVESYHPSNNEWSLRPSLNEKKGSLAGATLNNKIFALGGGNGVKCFSDVEMYDINVGRWIATQSMLQKRFALAAAELNNSLYAVGGYDGNNYLNSAERFDPREHGWTKIGSMNTKRGCHSLVVMNEKLYALGGYDDSTMSPSVEIYDPRLGKWMDGEPMNQPRGYSAAAVIKEFIYVIGGVKSGEDIVNTIECYKEGKGWQVTNLKGTGKRCFCSAIVLESD